MCCTFWVVFVFLSFFFNPSEPSFNASGENNNINNNNRLGHYLTIFHFAVVGCWLVFRANLHLVIWRLYRSAASHTETDKQTRESNLRQQSVSVVWLRWLMSEQVSKPCSFFVKLNFFRLNCITSWDGHHILLLELKCQKKRGIAKSFHSTTKLLFDPFQLGLLFVLSFYRDQHKFINYGCRHGSSCIFLVARYKLLLSNRISDVWTHLSSSAFKVASWKLNYNICQVDRPLARRVEKHRKESLVVLSVMLIF